MTKLTPAAANDIIASAFAEAAAMSSGRSGDTVLDAGARVVAYQRDDGASFLRPQMSAGKSRTRCRSPWDRAGRGGILMRDATGEIVGAVGISGDTSDNDEACAIAEAVGLNADGG